MGVSTPSSFAGEGIVPLWPERQSIFVQPELDYRVGRRRVYRGYHHSSRSEPWSQAKRFFDVIGAGLGILFFAPAFIAIAIAIKLTSPGPVFFSQRRYGYRNPGFGSTSSGPCTRISPMAPGFTKRPRAIRE